ncbi:MAG: amidase family protein [Arhodomonas sp.]|nr:amidase family protein [Arhodomonas sp.]
MESPRPLAELADAIATGRETAAATLERALMGTEEAPDAHTAVFAGTARAQAAACDRLIAAGAPAGPLGGVPVSLKALFDVAGRVTHAGFPGARRYRRQRGMRPRSRGWPPGRGGVCTGHTVMTEFAYSGLGLNPHYRHPRKPP